MRGTRWVLGVLAAAAAVELARADDAGYDLRGPAPEKGQAVLNKSKFEVKNAAVKIKFGGMDLEATQSMTATSEEETKVLAVDGRQVTKAQVKVLRERLDAVVSVGGNEIPDKKTLDLEGEVILSERTGPGKWKHSLVDTKPTEKQKKELDKRVGPENADDLYPAGKVKVGDEWTVDASALQRHFGGSITDLKGKLKMKLVKTEAVDGQECAVIETAGAIKGVAKEDEGDMQVELDLKITTWRAVKTGVDVRDRATGKLKMAGKVDMGGMKVELVLEGPVTIESTSRMK